LSLIFNERSFMQWFTGFSKSKKVVLFSSSLVLIYACQTRFFQKSKGSGADVKSADLIRKFDADSAPYADQDMDGLKSWAGQRVKDAQDHFDQAKLTRLQSPSYWGDEVVYQIQVDRFADGEKSNNSLNNESTQNKFEKSTEVGIEDYRHGGDLQGIMNRLDYLKTLGVTSLWITPILKSNGSYHGYCTSDFTKIDPGFSATDPEEGRALFRKLVQEAHAKGIKVVLDIVVNHVCDPKTQYDDKKTPFDRYFYTKCTQTLAGNNWTGNTKIEGQRDIVFGDTFFPPFRNAAFMSRCGNGGGSDGDAALEGDFSSAMFDLNTNNWDFQNVFTDLHKFWIAYADVDGFRADAAKHVTSDFMAYFSTEIRKYAESLGKKNFYIVGEVAGSTDEQAERVGKMKTDPFNPDAGRGNIPESLRKRLWSIKDSYLNHKAFPYPGLNALYDFGHSASAVNVNRGSGAPMNLKSWFWQGGELDNSVPGSEFGKLVSLQDTRENWNVLEIHDWPRFNLYGTGNDSKNPMRYKAYNGLGYLLTAPGVPVLYYGLEQGLNGDCHGDKTQVSDEAKKNLGRVCSDDSFSNHARYRQDMFSSGVFRLGSVVPEINRLAGIGRSSINSVLVGEDPYLNTTHDLFNHTAKLIDIRKSCKALRQGGMYFRAVDATAADKGGGFFAFSRVADLDEVLVLINSSSTARPVSKLILDKNLHQSQLGHKFVDMVSAKAWGTVSGGGGTLEFASGYSMAPQSVAIFYPEGLTKARALGGLVCK
jgi:glycosidase